VSRRPWTNGDTAVLRKLAARGLSLSEIGRRMDRDSRLIRERALRHGISVMRVIAPRFVWTAKADRRLRRLFPELSAAEIAERIGCSMSAVHNRSHALGLRKTDGWKSARTARRWLEGRHEGSRAHCFRPGLTPWNKGTHYVAGGRSAETRFKLGRPASAARNYVPIGAYRVTKDGQLERKMTDDPRVVPARRWTSVARLVWEAAHGPIPVRYVVRFKPGMHTTELREITIDRLECISMRENMRRNTIHNYPEPLKRVMQLRGALVRKINRKEKQA